MWRVACGVWRVAHLGSSIGPGLDVRGEMVCREAAAPEVDDLDLNSRVGLDQDVLRLEVACAPIK